MFDEIINAIKAYDRIVIHRHLNPDLDALGAQLGLKGIIVNNFQNKSVKVVGDENVFSFFGRMDSVEDAFYEGALAIVVDVSVSELISDDRYKLADKVLVIDHHLNDSDVADILYSDPEAIATCQIVTQMCMELQLGIDEQTATVLLSGLITDSGRFLYPMTNAKTMYAAGFLLERGARLQEIYDFLYVEDLNFKKLKGYFINHFKTTKNNVAYMKNDKTLKDRFEVTTFTISRGMVNQMAGIAGIPIWANFTEDDDNLIQCELRSKKIPIVHIAKKYGGGGHSLACGCTLNSWLEVDQLINDLDELLER